MKLGGTAPVIGREDQGAPTPLTGLGRLYGSRRRPVDGEAGGAVFRPVGSNLDMPRLEREIIEFWKAEQIFRRSVDRPAPRGEWVFYEGPPTANGKPGVHHVISRAFKDLFPRFKTMQGHRVARKGGWDTHGLPVEIAIEKRLGFECPSRPCGALRSPASCGTWGRCPCKRGWKRGARPVCRSLWAVLRRTPSGPAEQVYRQNV